MYNSENLNSLKMESISIGSDINTVSINSNASAKERVSDYIEQIHNPYCFKCDGTLVRVAFNPAGTNLESAIINYFSKLQEVWYSQAFIV